MPVQASFNEKSVASHRTNMSQVIYTRYTHSPVLTSQHHSGSSPCVDPLIVDWLTHHNVAVDTDIAKRHNTGHQGQHIQVPEEDADTIRQRPIPVYQGCYSHGHVEDGHQEVSGGEAEDEGIGGSPE